MKKFLEKIKKGLFAVGLFLITLPTKVLADVAIPTGSPDGSVYGVRTPSVNEKIVGIWNILKISIIPLILVIGLINFWKKSKKSTEKKTGIVVFVLIIIVLIDFLIGLLNNYGTFKFNVSFMLEILWQGLRYFITPVVVTIGFTIYFHKSKSNTEMKVITILLMLLMIVLFHKLIFDMYRYMI